MTEAQARNVARQEAAKAAMTEARARCTAAMRADDEAAWEAANADVNTAAAEWNAACAEAVSTVWA